MSILNRVAREAARGRTSRRLERILAMTPKPVETSRDDPPVCCPRHNRPMRRFLVAGIEVDRCGICGGIWLDAGELESLVASDRDARDAARMLDQADGEARVLCKIFHIDSPSAHPHKIRRSRTCK